MQELEPLGSDLQRQGGRARQIAAGPVQTSHKPQRDRIAGYEEENRNRRGGRLKRQRSRGGRCNDGGRAATN
jgi:hypothetical protein